MLERDVELPDGRSVHVYDSGPVGPGAATTIFWQHGTPQTGEPPPPLRDWAERVGARLVAHDRPGYGGSTADNGRPVAAVATDVAAIADTLGIERFAVFGASGGGPHALACAAVLGDRVRAVGCLASLAPFDASGLDWYAGMAPSGAREFQAAVRSRSALVRHLARTTPEELSELVPPDLATFAGPYGEWLVQTSAAGLAHGYEGAVEDDQAFVHAWGFDPAGITVPLLLVHGDADRFVPSSHSRWLAERCPTVELRVCADDGHVSIFDRGGEALDWILERLGDRGHR